MSARDHLRRKGFKTLRLVANVWTDDLANPVSRRALETELASLLTPEVLRHLPPSLGLDDTTISGWIDARAAESDVFLLRDRREGALLGILIIAQLLQDGAETLHVGFLFGTAHWGRGFATETLGGLASALEGTGPCVLLGGVDVDNTASARALQKTGFTADAALSTADTTIFIRRIG